MDYLVTLEPSMEDDMDQSLGVILGLLVFIFFREVQHSKERRELYNRIMARDLTDYNTSQRDPPKGRNFVKAGLKKQIESLEKGE